MAGTPGDAFARRFRSRSVDDRRRLCAALWAARGWETTVGEQDMWIEQGDRRRRVTFVGRVPIGLGDADIVVAAADTRLLRSVARRTDTTVLVPADLHRMLRFLIDRPTANEIASTHLGESLADMETKTGARGLDTAVPILLIVALGIAAFVLAFGVTTTDGPSPTIGEDEAATPVGEAPATSDEPAHAPVEHDPPNGGFGAVPPPGLSAGAVDDVETLVGAHREVITERPHRLSLRYEGPPGDPLFGNVSSVSYAMERNHSAYSVIVEREIIREDNESVQERRGEYRDGNTHVNWRHRGEDRLVYRNATYVERPIDPSLSHDPLDLYAAALRGEERSVTAIQRAGDLQHRITVEGPVRDSTFDHAESFEAVAIVSHSGRIVEFSIRYTHAETGEPVRIRVSYSGVDRVTTVSAPDIQ